MHKASITFISGFDVHPSRHWPPPAFRQPSSINHCSRLFRTQYLSNLKCRALGVVGLHLFSTTGEGGGRRRMNGKATAQTLMYPRHILPFHRNFPLLNRDPKSAALFINSLLCVLLIFMPPAISFSLSNGLALGSSSFS
jgi:hypothetical protein